jgi:cytochrome c55X
MHDYGWRSMMAVLALTVLCADATAADPSPARQQVLLHLLFQDCGSCHGLRLTGGLGPPLTPGALAGKPAEMLRQVILDGRAGTPMPPWRPFMSESEAAWLVTELQKGVSDGRQ